MRDSFKNTILSIDQSFSKRVTLEILQVNLGNMCNQRCVHCHVNASPSGKKIMTKDTVDNILKFLSYDRNLTLDITGGAPEINPNFEYLVHSARPMVKEIIVRSNLTVFFEPGKEHLPVFFKENNIHLICSLPCYTKENVDKQRGDGVFEKSIKALMILNHIGYGKDPNLKIDLVYNPLGSYLPGPQNKLESDYKRTLKEEHGIVFNGLLTMTNAPINRFKEQLDENNEYNNYLNILEDNFNEEVVDNIMCRTLLSVGWGGTLYDCDFNQANEMALKDEKGNVLNVKSVTSADLIGKTILFDEHCFCCTAGSGSSCQGALNRNHLELETQKENPSILEQVKEACGYKMLDKTRSMVSEYYSKILSTKKDLKTNACCDISNVAPYIKKIIKMIEPEIIDKFYGCGSPVPLELKDRAILDLGCGTGRDSYIISYLAGEDGKVVAVDMTQEQLDVANRYIGRQMEKFGFKKTNVEFIRGYIEDLKSIGLKDNTFDVVTSNCVVNLSPRKDLVLSEAYRILKEGGEFFFSDVFSDRRLPEWTKEDPVLVGECLGGALYWKDFERLASKVGFIDCRIYSKRNIELLNDKIREKIGFAKFSAITYRLFKIKELEDSCEDYGQVAEYKGSVKYSPHEFKLDEGHIFIKRKPDLVCGNTALMLMRSRFNRHFEIKGDVKTHFGLFQGCGTKNLIEKNKTELRPGDELSDGCCG